MSPPQWRALPREDRIQMLADANLRAREIQRASAGSKPRKRYNATESGEGFWLNG